MLHVIVLHVLNGIASRAGLSVEPLQSTAFVVAYFAAILLVAYLSFRYVEVPCRDWGRRKLDRYAGCRRLDNACVVFEWEAAESLRS